MKFRLITLCLVTAFSMAFTTLTNAATVTFTGGGDGTSWFDAANWDTGAVPTNLDDVIIDGTSQVTIMGDDAYANSIRINDNSALTIAPNDKLAVNMLTCNEEGIIVANDGKLSNYGALTIDKACEESLQIDDNGQFTNAGYYYSEDSDSEGIEFFDNSTGSNTGQIIIIDADTDGFELNDDTSFENYGSMSISDISLEGIEMDNNSYFKNEGTVVITNTGGDGMDLDDSGFVFENYGSITISIAENDEGLEADDGLFDNKASGVVHIFDVDDQGILIETGGEIRNAGTITVENTGEEGLTVQSTSLFFNENVFNITLEHTNTFAAIENDGTIENEACGVINILSDHEIDNGVGDNFTNDGVIATNFTGTNTNEGTITNNGSINAPAGFTAAPNAVAGAGGVVAGPVPAQSVCNIAIGSFGCTGSTTIDQASQTWTQTADACVPSFPYQSDNISYAFQQLCGDGSITAKVESVTPIGWGGISFRETVDDDSKMVQLMANGSTLLRRQIRNSTGSWAMPTQFPALNQKWIRIEREGNYFRGYRSPNGINWFFVFQTEISMNACVSVGVISHNYNVNIAATAVFTNVSVDQVVPLEDIELPLAEQTVKTYTTHGTLNASIYPNPTTGLVNVELEAIDEVVDLRIFNTLGQMVDAIRMDPSYGLNQTVNLEGMPTGTYFFHLIGEKGSKRIEQVILK